MSALMLEVDKPLAAGTAPAVLHGVLHEVRLLMYPTGNSQDQIRIQQTAATALMPSTTSTHDTWAG